MTWRCCPVLRLIPTLRYGLVGNGCEVVQASLLENEIRKKTNKPLETIVIREEGGSIRAVKKDSGAG